ncbi:MAG TPA: tetratricopeptide repeat protein [Ktedonobacteraceae bacterium]|nr:tetratricopeptide repeat protein [Ktedonobacteraceae bacterium]
MFHPDTSVGFNGLLMLYGVQEKYEQALSLHQRTLASCEQQLGPDHALTQTARQTCTSLSHMMIPLAEECHPVLPSARS